MDEPVLKIVTCHTEDCANCDVPLTLYCVEIVFCGPCGSVVTDVQMVD